MGCRPKGSTGCGPSTSSRASGSPDWVGCTGRWRWSSGSACWRRSGCCWRSARPRWCRRRVDLGSHVGVARTLAVIDATLIVAVVAFGLTGAFAVAVAAFWVISLLREVRDPVFTAWVNQGLEPRTRATINSMASQMDAVGQIVGGPAIGWLALAWVPAALVTAGLLRTPSLALSAGRSGGEGASPRPSRGPSRSSPASSTSRACPGRPSASPSAGCEAGRGSGFGGGRFATSGVGAGRGQLGRDLVHRPPGPGLDRQPVDEGERGRILAARPPLDDPGVQGVPPDLLAPVGADDRERPAVALAEAAERDVGVLGGEVRALQAPRPGVLRALPSGSTRAPAPSVV